MIKTLWLFNQNNCLNCHKYQTSPFSYCSGFSQPKIWQLLYSVSQINWSFIPNLMEIIIWSEVLTTKLKMLKTFNSVKSSPIPQQQVGEDGSYSISLATVRITWFLLQKLYSNLAAGLDLKLYGKFLIDRELNFICPHMLKSAIYGEQKWALVRFSLSPLIFSTIREILLYKILMNLKTFYFLNFFLL